VEQRITTTQWLLTGLDVLPAEKGQNVGTLDPYQSFDNIQAELSWESMVGRAGQSEEIISLRAVAFSYGL
jgi:hypothetical protein